jgi:hypothetical protein
MDFLDDAPVLRSVSVAPPPLSLQRTSVDQVNKNSFNNDAVFTYPKSKSAAGEKLRLEIVRPSNVAPSALNLVAPGKTP